MRLAFINSTHRWGGIKTWAIDLGREAVQAGHEVVLYGRDERFMSKGALYGMQGRLVNFGADFSPTCIAHFRREFTQNRPDQVIVNVGKDLRSAGIAAWSLGIPTTVMVGAPKDFTQSLSRLLVHKWLQPAYICCSKFIYDGIQDFVPYMQKAKMDWVHPGTFMPDIRPKECSNPLLFIATSQLTPPKRHIDLIEGCALLRDMGKDFRLRIVGIGDQEEKLRARSKELKLEDKIEFRGFSSNIGEELVQADVFILPTLAEPLGIALEEAMAYGLFPLARNCGGAPEIWPSQFKDWLLPEKAQAQDFAYIMNRVLEMDPTQLNQAKIAVQTHARQSFNLKKQFDEFLVKVVNL